VVAEHRLGACTALLGADNQAADYRLLLGADNQAAGYMADNQAVDYRLLLGADRMRAVADPGSETCSHSGPFPTTGESGDYQSQVLDNRSWLIFLIHSALFAYIPIIFL
jgi:hypothetical protein